MTNFKSLSNSEIFCYFLHFKLRDILSTLLLVLDPYSVFLSLFLRTSYANLEYFPQRQWKDVDLFAMSYSRVHSGILKSGELCCKGVSTTWFLRLMSVHRRGQVPVALGLVSCLWKPSKMLSICLGHELPWDPLPWDPLPWDPLTQGHLLPSPPAHPDLASFSLLLLSPKALYSTHGLRFAIYPTHIFL